MPSDKHRANTKVEDADTNLLLEGHRYRLLGAGIFLSPDPLEYVDGLHRYAYCGFNPWGRWDPLGLSIWGEFVDEGIGIYDRSNKPSSSGVSDFSTNINFKADGLVAGKEYFLVQKVNASIKNGNELNLNRESDNIYFHGVADENGVATFYKSGNVIQDEENSEIRDISFVKGKETDINLDFDMKVIEKDGSGVQTHSQAYPYENPVTLRDYINGKFVGEANGQKRYGILSALYAHSEYQPQSPLMDQGGKVVDEGKASLSIRHTGGNQTAKYRADNIRKKPSGGSENRTNVKLEKEKEE